MPDSSPEIVQTATPIETDALIIGVHASDANWRERRFAKKVRERFGLPVTEVMLDREGQVLSVTTE